MTSAGPPEPADHVVVVDLTGCGWADLQLVDLLARLCLQGRRLGARVVVVPDERRAAALGTLLELTGLAGVVRLAGPVRSQPRRQTEALEEAGVEEVVDVRDPAVAQLEHLQAPGLVPRAGRAGLVLGEPGGTVEVDRQQP
jgi:hypothetical protein